VLPLASMVAVENRWVNAPGAMPHFVEIGARVSHGWSPKKQAMVELRHPQTAEDPMTDAVRIEDLGHASTEGLPAIWVRTDEWYNFRSNPRGAVHVLATLDEATYSSGKMGVDHPIAWCQEIDCGRSWYTAMGHTSESYVEPLYRLHVLGGIESAAGVAGGCAR
jgi:cytochrome c